MLVDGKIYLSTREIHKVYPNNLGAKKILQSINQLGLIKTSKKISTTVSMDDNNMYGKASTHKLKYFEVGHLEDKIGKILNLPQGGYLDGVQLKILSEDRKLGM